MNNKTLTIQEVADLLNLSYRTVYSHRFRWGFFQMEGSRVWRVFENDLEKCRKKKNNVIRLVRSANNKKEGGVEICRSIKEEISIGSTLPPRVASELDRLLAPK
ncbi:helix-turn-helix domain-containing protein [Actinobacillus porcinus]|uniref:helix-turn-helix domain-containing protein n=1 Tax=Actinobacillus porcinus TaxID=51048 RepID=UPI0023553635|nr:helix-turn-helix domain-containing protein [Actinobacillus porcinus]MCI5763149.1 helix-turn-helix domain-containing protein [Actinobacillus porcinus]MDY5421210.1 helix-turn-helix domain-containing protein [Actinobacillus porcinus]